MVLKPNFPLPKGYFGPTRLTDDQEDRYRQLVRARLASALRDEHDFVHVKQRQVRRDKWRLVNKKHQLRIYRRRKHSLTSDEDNRKPSMLSVGRMEGSLEDVIYGSYDKSTEELKTTISFVDLATKDCTVLHNIDLATPDDPFHYIGMKWLLTQLPASMIVRPRDWCYLEAMGIEHDSDGNRFGYIIQHSTDLKNCPPFDRRAVIRGRSRLSFIFREPVPGIIEVFAQGLFDPAGELIQRFTTIVTGEVIAGVFKSVPCAEAKKLTLLALRNYKGKLAPDQLQRSCFMCHGSGSMFASLKVCRVCGLTVCSQCRVKKSIFIGPAHSICKVTCCRACIAHAKSMEIRPAEPSFSILGEQHLPQEPFWLDTGGMESFDSHEEPTTVHDDSNVAGVAEEDIDTDDLSELDADGYRFSTESGISEDDVERIIASLIHQRLQESSSRGADTPAIDATGGPQEQSSPREAGGTVVGGSPDPRATAPTSSSRNESSVTPEQAAIFERILALQTATHKVFEITQANNEMMKSFT